MPSITGHQTFIGPAPRILRVAGTEHGCAAITTLSQEQLDHMCAQPGEVVWAIEGTWLILGRACADGMIPEAALTCANRSTAWRSRTRWPAARFTSAQSTASKARVWPA
jgi:hypothetical protein